MSLVPYAASPVGSAMDTESPTVSPAKGERASLRLLGMEPLVGSVLLKDKTIVVDKSLLSGFEKQCNSFTSQLITIMDGAHTIHAARPASDLTARPACFIILPRLGTMHDGAQVIILKAQGGVQPEDLDKCWLLVSDGKNLDHKTASWVTQDQMKSIDGPVTNELGQRKWLSFSTGFMARDPELRDVGLTSLEKVK